ncbi:PREDICTED: bidirectional sugar transporter N3 [Theobroma cacao]|uniref:Bidirectional sugar transporter SWEET n=1 Tax=Theobroma cacao TaxID=3641 RepID=A0AB32VZV4_THECC|nr:PREDICTED: bidirectional sugar transporter N3 [Theobroma cacao]
MAYHPWIIVSGILGNILSFMVYLAPLPTFLRVYRKKSTEGFQSIPYVVALVSAVLWIYYATLKSNAFLLMTINSFGCFVETIYTVVFIIYAPKKARILTMKLLLLFNFGGLLLILLLTHFFSKGPSRIHIVGWFCVVSSAGVFAAPLSIMRLVVRTKSVEFMPFALSFFLTLSAIMWLIYGVLLKDFYISLPNIIGVVLGMIQMVLFVVYKKYKNIENEQKQLPVQVANGKNLAPIKASNNTDSSLQVSGDVGVGRDENPHDHPLQHSHKSMESTNQAESGECAV